MKTVFADTFYYLALLNPLDAAHQRAEQFSNDYDGKMVTTEWVLTEVADAMAGPRNRPGFLRLLNLLRKDPDVTIVPADSALFNEGVDLYARRKDKDWSLTDCMSFLVMQREGLDGALTGDHNFEQAGYKMLLAW